MASALLPPDESRRILDLAQRDRAAASEAVAKLPLDAQVALVCDASPAQRSALLELLPAPEEVIPRLPEAELCFTVKAVGLADAAWILEHASAEQVIAAVDLDAWHEHAPDLARLNEWLEVLSRTERTALARALRALDAELLILLLMSRIAVWQRPSGDDSWEPPAGSQTLEGQFYYAALSEKDDLAAVTAALRCLFEEDYWTYFRTMQGVVWELESDTQEWAYRWRKGRLEDLGFPSLDEAMSLYRFLRPEERGRITDSERPLDIAAWHLPVWVPGLPERADGVHRIFRAFALLDDEERRACFYAFVAVVNKLAVADRMPLSDSETTPRAIEKAARLIDLGLKHVAEKNALDDVEVVRRVTLERLFRVGANLDPAGARP